MHLIAYAPKGLLRPSIHIGLYQNTATEHFHKNFASIGAGATVMAVHTDKFILAPEFTGAYQLLIDPDNGQKPEFVFGPSLNAGLKSHGNLLMLFYNLGIHKKETTHSIGISALFDL